MSIAKRSEPARTLHPALVSSIYAALSSCIELSIFHMEHFYKRMIEVDVLQVIQLLEYKMAWIIQDVAARVLFSCFPKALKRNSIVQVLTRVYLITKIDSSFIEGIQNRKPSLCKFFKAIL